MIIIYVSRSLFVYLKKEKNIINITIIAIASLESVRQCQRDVDVNCKLH